MSPSYEGCQSCRLASRGLSSLRRKYAAARLDPRNWCASLIGVLLGAAASAPCAAAPAARRLWETEPSLWQMAQRETISQPVPPQDPQPLGGSFYASAPNLSMEKLKISLWGPPDAVTLSLGKTDVWDRRCFQERPLTIAGGIQSTRLELPSSAVEGACGEDSRSGGGV
jgi:hypothetical protein